MCKGKNEPGGPYRCSGHARTARDIAQAKADVATSAWERADADHTTACNKYEAALTEAGIHDPITRLLGHGDADLDEQQRARLDALAADCEAAGVRLAESDVARSAAQEALAQREDEYRATPDGAAEAARDLERAAAVDSSSPMVADKGKHQRYITQQMRRLQAAEQQMANEAADRATRWNNGNSKPPVRAAFPGGQHVIGRSGQVSKAGFIVATSGMHGSYTNTFGYDPDSQETEHSSGDPDYMVRTSQMQLVREDMDGQRRRLTVPMHTTGCTDTNTAAPTVREALATAVARADSYNPDYATWARNNGYDATDHGWRGSSSYTLGRAAHKEARNAHERIRSFLDDGEYTMIADELRDREAV